MATNEDLREIALRYPGTVETTSYGTLSFKVGKKMVCRLWDDRQRERLDELGSEVLVLTCPEPRAEMLAEADSERFFRTDHYRGYDFVLVRIARFEIEELSDLIDEAWRSIATPKLLVKLDGPQ